MAESPAIPTSVSRNSIKKNVVSNSESKSLKNNNKSKKIIRLNSDESRHKKSLEHATSTTFDKSKTNHRASGGITQEKTEIYLEKYIRIPRTKSSKHAVQQAPNYPLADKKSHSNETAPKPISHFNKKKFNSDDSRQKSSEHIAKNKQLVFRNSRFQEAEHYSESSRGKSLEHVARSSLHSKHSRDDSKKKLLEHIADESRSFQRNTSFKKRVIATTLREINRSNTLHSHTNRCARQTHVARNHASRKSLSTCHQQRQIKHHLTRSTNDTVRRLTAKAKIPSQLTLSTDQEDALLHSDDDILEIFPEKNHARSNNAENLAKEKIIEPDRPQHQL